MAKILQAHHSDSRQYIKADISNLPDSTEVPIVELYAFTGDEEVIPNSPYSL